MSSKLLKRLNQGPVAADEAAVLRLLKLLSNDSQRIRLEAAGLLIRAGETAVPGLVAALGHPNEQVWQLASAALCKIGDPAAPYLIEALSHPDESIRMYAAAILQRMGRPAPDEKGFALMWQEYGKLLARHHRQSKQR